MAMNTSILHIYKTMHGDNFYKVDVTGYNKCEINIYAI